MSCFRDSYSRIDNVFDSNTEPLFYNWYRVGFTVENRFLNLLCCSYSYSCLASSFCFHKEKVQCTEIGRISWVQLQFRTLDLWQSWRELNPIASTVGLNCFWEEEWVSWCLAGRWCQTIPEIEMTDEAAADAEWQGWVQSEEPHGHGLPWWAQCCCRAGTSSAYEPRAGSQSCLCFVHLPDGQQTAECVRLGGEASICLEVLPRASWHDKRAEYQWFVTDEWPFSGQGTKSICFSKCWHFPQFFIFFLAGICVSAQKLSRFSDWLELSCCFLNCCSHQPVLVEKNIVCAALLVFMEICDELMLAGCQTPTKDLLSLLRWTGQRKYKKNLLR